MRPYLFRFGYESPNEKFSNDRDGTDFESSNAVWILADDADSALAWGQTVAAAFVSQLFSASGPGNYSWQPSDFANWVEDCSDEIECAENYGGIQTVAIGVFPDFAEIMSDD